MSQDAVDRLAAAMTNVATSLQAPIVVADALATITQAAVASIDGIDAASITLTHPDGRVETRAPTAVLAEKADALQYEYGEGPCVRAALDVPVVVVPDVATDSRWPAYGPAAAAAGVGSQVAFQFRADYNHIRGGLNLYGARPGELDAQGMQLGALFAAQVAVTMGWEQHDANLQIALSNREQIGIAIGILMERYQLDTDRAFSFLVRTSQTSNVRLRDVAATVVTQAVDNAR